MDFELTDEQRAFQQAARDFASSEMAPHAAAWDAGGIFPRELFTSAGALGFCGLYADEPHGLAMPRLDATLVFEELAVACPSTTAYLSIHNMATWMVTRFATAEVVAQWAPSLTSGAQLASYCLTEAGSGSDAASLRTTARLEGDRYLLDGSKAFISGAGSTDLLVVMARTGAAGAAGISAFAVPSASAGISFGREESKLGWRTQPTRTITFDGVAVPVANRLGAEGDGFRIALQGLDGGRVNIASCSIGAAQGALNAAREHMVQRRQFGRALADFQALQFKLADMATELVSARLMVRLAATKIDAKASDANIYCAMAKRLATDIAFEVCNQALQIHGGYGITGDYPLERFLRDARVHQIVEGTNEIMRVIVARRMLEDDATDRIR